MPFKGGMLQVEAFQAADTHRLLFIREGQRESLARHPNGYSCHALAKRLLSGDADSVRAQADYIIRCGGASRPDLVRSFLEEIVNVPSVLSGNP